MAPAFSQAPSRRGTIRSAGTLVRVSGCRLMFRNDVLRNVFAGIGAHSALPLESPGSSAVAWALMGAAHAAGWPIVRGGSQRISDALALYLSTLDGRIVTNHRVDCLDSFTNQLVLCDVTPRQLLSMARNTCQTNSAALCESTGMDLAYSKWIGRSMVQFRGVLLIVFGPPPSIWAEPGTK